MKGKLICIEGGDGCGKTTTLKYVKEWAKKDNKHFYIFTKEPGGTQMGRQIRRILLNPNYDLNKRQQAYLFAVARRDHIKHVIAPDMKHGDIVICDRYLLSSLAYQSEYQPIQSLKTWLTGHHDYRDVNDVKKINLPMITYHQHTFLPDANIYFKLTAPIEIQRLKGRPDKHDKFDQAICNAKNLVRLQRNYQIALQQSHEPSYVIDATLSPKARAKKVIKAIKIALKTGVSYNP